MVTSTEGAPRSENRQRIGQSRANSTFAFHQFNHPFRFHIAESARKQSAVSGLLSKAHASKSISRGWFFVGDFEDFADVAARFDRCRSV